MLCAACDTVFQGLNPPWYYINEKDESTPAYQHHPSPAHLVRAAQSGCHICLIVWKKLAPDERRVLISTWSSPFLHNASQAVQRLWRTPVATYSWSPVWWSNHDFGIRFQFGNYPFWKKIIFRLLPANEARPAQDVETTEPVGGVDITAEGALLDDGTRASQQLSALTSLWSPHVKLLVQKWYQQCTTDHAQCRMGDDGHVESHPAQVTFQPTRILDLSDNMIRLDVNPDAREERRYASLTHRWSLNPETMPRLSADNLSSFTTSIDPSILTPIFRDAVELARKLQFRYLWIDSLCIQQSGPGWELDWARESAVMGEIYRHAFINIQAGRDAYSTGLGLFQVPADREVDPFRVEVSRCLPRIWRGHKTEEEMVEVKGSFSIVEEDFARDELLGNPINQRGWVLQERLLSHRIIHFGEHQIFWECRQLLACETFPEGLPKTIPKTMARAATQIVAKMPTFEPGGLRSPTFNVGFANILKKRMTAAPVPVPTFPSLTVHRDLFAWYYLAELYSACSLTRETDKLVAISGLAQIFGSPAFKDRAADVVAYLSTLALPRAGGAVTDFAKATRHVYIASRPKGDYLAGLWRSELIPCLLWHVSNGRQADGSAVRRIQGARAPTWSWASVNGLLHASIYQNWKSADGLYLAEIAYADTTPVFEDHSWGHVSDGKIILSAKVIHQKNLDWPAIEEEESRRVSAHTSEIHVAMVRRIRLNSASVARLRVLRADVLCYLDDMEEFTTKLRRSGSNLEIALLPLIGLQRRRATWATSDGYIDEVYEYHGLVVALAKDLTCTRLGYFRVRDVDVFGHVLARSADHEITIF